MADDKFDYAARTQTALLSVIHDILQKTAENGLPGAHHFYISFRTDAPGLTLSQKLRDAHPQEMTIVLQNQFDNLQVDEDGFAIGLSFNRQPEDLYVPFTALTKFYDPAVSFGLVFDDNAQVENIEPTHDLPAFSKTPAFSKANDTISKPDAKSTPNTGEVINLDNFRDT